MRSVGNLNEMCIGGSFCRKSSITLKYENNSMYIQAICLLFDQVCTFAAWLVLIGLLFDQVCTFAAWLVLLVSHFSGNDDFCNENM